MSYNFGEQNFDFWKVFPTPHRNRFAIFGESHDYPIEEFVDSHEGFHSPLEGFGDSSERSHSPLEGESKLRRSFGGGRVICQGIKI